MAKARKPWKRPAPAGASHRHLSEGQKRSAKQHAKRAGRPYPNLVDNLNATRRS